MGKVVAAKVEIVRVIDNQPTTPALHPQLGGQGQGNAVRVDGQRGGCTGGQSSELAQPATAPADANDVNTGLVLAADLKRGRLQDRRQAFGPNHPQTADALINLAGSLCQIHDYAGAWGHAEEAYGIRYRVLGPYHPETAAALQARNWASWAGSWAAQSQANQVPGHT